jgi:hypothetical protein
LILESPYPPYNSRRQPSARGLGFLGALDELCFGINELSGPDVVFVDEIDFPARHADEQGCAPDYTVFAADRCWIIELKTEPGSHRPSQIPDYFERARHYHPTLRIDITYLTSGLRQPFDPPTREWERYAHVERRQVIALIDAAWGADTDDELHEAARLLILGAQHLDQPSANWWEQLGYAPPPVLPSAPTPPSAPRTTRTGALATEVDTLLPGVIDDALAAAEATGQDGQQRAVGLEIGGLEALQELRLVLHRACQTASEVSPLGRVQPWLWSADTSGGRAMTPAGEKTGYEVRLSRSRAQPEQGRSTRRPGPLALPASVCWMDPCSEDADHPRVRVLMEVS